MRWSSPALDHYSLPIERFRELKTIAKRKRTQSRLGRGLRMRRLHTALLTMHKVKALSVTGIRYCLI